MNLESSIINEINKSELTFQQKSDVELQEYAKSLKKRFINTEQNLDALLVESFSLVREASKRVLGLRPFDTQLLGGIYLHQGKIAEMKTGEGKTLVASLPSFLNALSGKGVHIVTVNNYLAKRDQEFIGRIFRFLNLRVGLIQENMTLEEKQANYNADFTYVTNSELAFDYLRDCTAQNISQLVQRPFNYCIIDEVDSILIDEARTPLILSSSIAESKLSKEKIFVADSIVRCLKSDDYEIEEKTKNVFLTPKGRIKVEDLLEIENLYDLTNPWINFINNSLRAHFSYKVNNDYIVNKNKVFIVDEFTGRVLADRRWSDGLHQAVEVKENVSVSPDSETFASITYQNFFRLYPKLSGMTGTAKTEEAELQSIYGLSVMEVPTYKPMIRKDLPDLVYLDEYAKWKAIRDKCLFLYREGVPVLVGTSTLSKSELLSQLLFEKSIPHQLLNARPENVRKESEIVAQAGKKSSLTIATNMAGRGTDILLGGNKNYLSESSLNKYFLQLSGKLFIIPFVNKQLDLSPKKLSFSLKLNCINEFFDILHSKKSFQIYSVPLRSFYNFIWSTHQIRPIYEQNLIIFYPNVFSKLIRRNFNFSKLDLQLPEIFFYIYLLFKLKETYYSEHIKKEQNEIKQLGGLYVIGTDRQDSRRIDNQLRGRSGRQGDEGTSQFFLSLDDRLLKLFADENLKNIIRNLTLDPEEPIKSKLVTRSLEKAQEKVESLNFSIRKQLFEYDEVLEGQRAKLFLERRKLLQTNQPRKWIIQCCELVIDDLILDLKQNTYTYNSSLKSKSKLFLLQFILRTNIIDQEKFMNLSLQELRTWLYKKLWNLYLMREEEYVTLTGVTNFSELERLIIVKSIDECWKNHLQKMNSLKESVGWRVFAQKKPIREYKISAYYLFKEMLVDISHQTFLNMFLLDYF